MSNPKPRIAVIIGTTRKTRWAMEPATWTKEKIEADGRMDAEIVDLAEFDLPMFDEPASNKWMPSADPKAVAWQKALDGYDGFVFIVAEYNHSISGPLKNALDQAFNEWGRKPAAMVGYGGVGAARAIEHLRTMAVELRMVNVAAAVHLAAGAFVQASPLGAGEGMAAVDEILAPSAAEMIEELYWWADLLKGARTSEAAAAA